MGNVKNLLFKKWWIIAVIALLTGLFMVSEEAMDCLDLSNRLGFDLRKESIMLLVFECLFFVIYSWLLLVVNTVWQPRRLLHVKHFAATALCAIVFLAIANLFIWPWIETVNHLAHDQIREFLIKWSDRRMRHIPRYLHVPIEAWYNGIVTLAVVIYTLSRIYLLNIRQKEYERKMELLRGESLQSRLDALSNQINPHFFFNSLNSLYGLIAEDQKEKSLGYLDNLSQVFRYILQSERKGLVSLREELDFIEKYRFMLRVKYDEKLRFEIEVDETLLDEQLPVLSLLPAGAFVVATDRERDETQRDQREKTHDDYDKNRERYGFIVDIDYQSQTTPIGRGGEKRDRAEESRQPFPAVVGKRNNDGRRGKPFLGPPALEGTNGSRHKVLDDIT